jgi:3-oxoacyl-[acyl-carrier protein] reductase
MHTQSCLQGKTAVITGASSGIGRAIACLFACHGAHVVVNYNRSQARAEQVVSAIEGSGGKATAVQADVSKSEDIDRLIGVGAGLSGRIHVWANIAGADILTGAAVGWSDLERLDHLIAVDLRGTILCSWRIAERMRLWGSGVILNMSWDLAIHGMEGRNPEIFAAVKAGVLGFSKCLARSFAPEVRVNDLAPGWIETAFATEVMDRSTYKQVVDHTPLRRFGTPEDVAHAALYLASDEAAFITGQTLRVNGGVIG